MPQSAYLRNSNPLKKNPLLSPRGPDARIQPAHDALLSLPPSRAASPRLDTGVYRPAERAPATPLVLSVAASHPSPRGPRWSALPSNKVCPRLRRAAVAHHAALRTQGNLRNGTDAPGDEGRPFPECSPKEARVRVLRRESRGAAAPSAAACALAAAALGGSLSPVGKGTRRSRNNRRRRDKGAAGLGAPSKAIAPPLFLL